MLKRREKPKFLFRIRQLIWPSMSWERLLRYFKLRIVRLSHAPEPLARAIACGITVSFFPFFGIHALMGAALAFLMRANVLAAALASLVIPPVVLPLIFSLDFMVGKRILRYFGVYGQGNEAEFVQKATQNESLFLYDIDEFMIHFREFILPAFVGSAIFMVLVWPATYMAAHKLIEVIVKHHHKHKHKKLKRTTS